MNTRQIDDDDDNNEHQILFKVLQYHQVFPKDHQTIGTVRRIGEIVARKQVLICFNIVLPGNE